MANFYKSCVFCWFESMEELLRYVCQELEKRNIAYMLSGGVAMSVYTIPRFTRDIDIVVVLKTDDLDSFAGIFATNYYFHRPSVEEEVKSFGMFNVIDNSTGLKIDFVLRKPTEYRQIEFDRRRREIVFGFKAWVVTAEDLLISKLIWIQNLESGYQKADIQNILIDNDLDIAYINYWCNKLNLNTFGLL